MPETPKETESRKAALKKLIAARRPQMIAATARMKGQKKEIKAIKDELQRGERTVPEIAAATGIPSAASPVVPVDLEEIRGNHRIRQGRELF